MSLAKKIEEDMKAALKSGDSAKVSTLRLLRAAILNASLAQKKEVLEDAQVLEVIRKQIKQHQESVEAYTQAGRADAADKEKREAEVLRAYHPAAMDEAELEALVKAAVEELGASGPAALGSVMKAVMANVRGRADGKKVNDLVRRILQGP